MDVLIKGMKMPKGCITCMFKFESLFNRTMWCEWLDDPLGDYTKCDEEWRHPDCPLVEVPTPHGSLKDTDELKDWIEAWFTMHRSYHPYSRSNLIPTTEIVDIIDRLPTIIEAEEGEDDE